MKHYLITITFNAPYPKKSQYNVQAGSFAVAVGKALREWKQENKGHRVKELSIKAITL